MADSMEQKIIAKIAEMAEGITVANGYRQDVNEVNKQDTSLEKINVFPAINIIPGKNTSYHNEGASDSGRHRKTMPVMLEYWMESPIDQWSKTSDAIADIELRFFDDTVVAARKYNLENTVLIVRPIDSFRFSIEDGKDHFGFDFLMDVIFRQSMKDPSVQY